jgi:hypothetical protein
MYMRLLNAAQLFRDSEATLCNSLPLIANAFIHSSVRSLFRPFIYSSFTLIFTITEVLLLGSLLDYGMPICHGPNVH